MQASDSIIISKLMLMKKRSYQITEKLYLKHNLLIAIRA